MASSNPNIERALTGKSNSVKIPQPREAGFWAGKASFAAVTARPVPSNKQGAALPTPPNSISPTLPAQGFQGLSQSPLTPPAVTVNVDSDIDLQDAVEHAKAQDQSQQNLRSIRDSLAGIDAAGAITPALLAMHHLPRVLLENGPLAIRHIMGYLTTSVPGFSGIPPAKARRLVVAALEGRTSSDEQPSDDSSVSFEKVGWGKWDARRRGHPMLKDPLAQGCHSSPSQGGLHIPGNAVRSACRRIDTGMGGRQDSEMEYDAPAEDISMLEHEADRMSLDQDESCSSSEPPDDNHVVVNDYDEVTDEEDWASIGAAALRAGSFPRSALLKAQPNRQYPARLDPKIKGRGAGPPSTAGANSTPAMPFTAAMYKKKEDQYNTDETGLLPTSGDAEQRAAVEALLKLASV